jgi:hypothetical protein
MFTCKVCNLEFDTGKRFSNHLKKAHQLSGKEYTKTYHQEYNHICLNCTNETRYVAFTFKKYCKECSSVAARAGGRKGGKSKAWNKGLTKESDSRIADQALRMSGEGNPFYGRKHTEESLNKIRKLKLITESEFNNRMKLRTKDFVCLTKYENYRSRQGQYIKLECVACGKINEKTLQALERGSRCHACFPNSRSQDEDRLAKFVKTLTDVKLNDRTLLKPKEVDIFAPSKNVAIEYNGLYWHSELSDKCAGNKKYHLNKTTQAAAKNVALLHIFSDDWRDREEICKSIISHKLGTTHSRIYARKCSVTTVKPKVARIFFDNTHISGFSPAKKYFGLMFNNELIACLSLRTPRHKKKYANTIEVCRFSTKLNTSVPGGLSRLLKYAKKYARDNNIEKIMTYVDRRIGTGGGYEACGFQLVGDTGVDYWYTDGSIRYNRFLYRAKGNMSEAEVAKLARVYKVYGCGSLIYEMSV